MKEIKKLQSSVSFHGLGGPLMELEGLESLVDINKTAVMGFWEVLKSLRFLKSVEKMVLSHFKKNSIQAVILIDYPGFNLRIAKKIKKINPSIPIFYYISPQVWAWKEGRIDVIKKYVDKMIVIFEFEYLWYKKRGVEAEFVGHPLLDVYKNTCKASARKKLGLSSDKRYLTLFPGSRKQEVHNHLPYMLQAIKDPFFKDFEILLGQANTLNQDISDYYNLENIKIIKSNTKESLEAADFAWIGSGTSTLEAVLLNVPFILVYKTSWVSWKLMKKFVKVRFAGMPNIIMNEPAVPELLQENYTVSNLIDETKQFFKNTSCQKKLFFSYEKIQSRLGQPGASARTARCIVSNVN
jgi:lipid-A-disaccharide synthase